MAACLVESFGYELHYLGANTPVADVVDTVWRWRPALVLLAAVYPEHVPAMERTVRALDALPDAVRPRWVMVRGKAALERRAWLAHVPVIPLDHRPQSVKELQRLLRGK